MGVLFLDYYCLLLYCFSGSDSGSEANWLTTHYCNLLIPNTTLFDGSFLLLFLHCVTLQLERYIKYKSGQWPVGESSVLVVGTH